MVAGSPYEWEVSFVNPQTEKGVAYVTFEIIEEKTVVGLGEFVVAGLLESYDNVNRKHDYASLTFTEVRGGVFQSQTLIEKRFNRVSLSFSSVPNLMPGKYTFILEMLLNYEK